MFKHVFDRLSATGASVESKACCLKYQKSRTCLFVVLAKTKGLPGWPSETSVTNPKWVVLKKDTLCGWFFHGPQLDFF